ncbi:MAG: MFS transporter [Actinomyces sp.]|nr:MFS transporter [Actinomyces sp.]MCI1641537.1 MFS transporter [Actinomyces sp.]MCI1661719.1 MFS transporter [Actinomyces sp.]MCI1690467.1 MFS transporter [Actinomyces sp.]MCI1786445.1 MFS transporter [Actinomyces sp.]MCI1866149.1 MFS transporter [Actinomyces sp.]
MSTIAAGLTFYVPVSALFLVSRGQTLGDIFVFESILLVSILIVEVPSGLLADRVDRRSIIITGFVLNAIAEVLFAAGNSFAMFAASFAVSGFGIAMLTGVQDAYIYDALGDDADDKSVGVWGHMSSLELGAGVVGSVVGGLLATVNLSWPAVAAAIAACLAAVAAFFLAHQRPSDGDEDESETPLVALRRGMGLLFTSPILLYTAVGSSAAFVLFNAVFTLNQPLFEAARVPVAMWGVIGGGAQLCAALYNHFAGRVVDRVGRKSGLLLAMGYGAAGFALMVIPNAVAVVIGFVLVVVGMNARGPITRAVANKVIPTSRRATVLNAASTVGSLVGVVANPLIGRGAEASPAITVGVIALMLFFSCSRGFRLPIDSYKQMRSQIIEMKNSRRRRRMTPSARMR